MNADYAATAIWQRGGDRRATRPRPIPRPGVKDDVGVKKFGKPSGMTREEGREFLRKWGAGELKGLYVEESLDMSA